LEFSTITDAIDPTVTITEFLARLFQHTSKKPCDYPDITQMRNMSDTAKDPADPGIGEGATTSANTTTPLFSQPGTDLCMDWGDACSLGCLPDLNRYLLLVMEKGTEYFVSFPPKARAFPLALLKLFVTCTGRKIRYLRIDGSKEFQSDEIKEYCAENDVVLQLVVAYNHTMQARVEGAIGCVKQHNRTSLLHANKPTRFWDDATKDFSIKKVYLWASPDTRGKLQTPHDRMQPAFSGTYNTVAVPFGSRVIAQLHREHRKVKNGSFGDRFVEGIYLYSDSAAPCIWMFSIALQRKIKVQDIKSYPLPFPFKDPSCLTRNTPTMMKDMSKMHEEDAHDDDMIAMETSNQIHARAQMCAANSHILEPTDVDYDINPPLHVRNPVVPAMNETRDNATPPPSILPPRATSGDDLAAARPSVQHDRCINLHANLADYSELEIAKARAHHSVEMGLPKHYAPNHLVPDGKMCVVGVKAKKISLKKAVLIVKFISPPSSKNVQIQLFCTSLEPKTEQGQGADFSIMTALKTTNPGAKSRFDLGVRCKPCSDTTCSMIAAFDSMMGGTTFDASQASSDDFETSEQNPFRDERYLRSFRDPVGYTKGAPDPKHHGLAMRTAMKAEWIQSQKSEMDGLWRRDVFQKVPRSSLTPQDRVCTIRFHNKIKQKGPGREFDKCKVRLVMQGQHMRRKGEDNVGDYDDAFSPVPAASGFRIILSLATQQNMLTDHIDISQAFVQEGLLPGDGYNGKVYILFHLQDMMKILSMCIACLSHFTACPLQPELGTAP